MAFASSPPSAVLVLAGGVGGSRFVRGVLTAFPDSRVDVIVNTADDITMHGLRVCPDLDTLTYALAGVNDAERGWGRADEGWRIMDELRAFSSSATGSAAEPTWFALGDRDVALHLVRTGLLASGARLTQATARLAARWLPERVRLLPMTDHPVETQVHLQDGRRVHFQEYWVRLHADPAVDALEYLGIGDARPSGEVVDAIGRADVVLVAPSNPVVSIGPVLAVPGIREALVASSAPIVGFSGIIGGAPVLGMAHKLLPAIGVPVSAEGVARHYGRRAAGGLLDAWLMDDADAGAVDALRADGFTVEATGLLMTSPEVTAGFIRRGLQLVGGH